MAIDYNDPYYKGIGNIDLGNMNLGQVPVNNMQTAGWWPEVLGGTSDEQDAENAALEQIQEIRKNQFEGYPSGTNPAWVEEYKGDYPDLYNKYQDKQKQIKDLKEKYPENINIQEASLDNDFYNEHGYPKTAGLGVLTGLEKIFGPKLGAYLFKTGRYKTLNKISKKVAPVVTSVLTGGQTQAGDGGGGYHDQGGYSTQGGFTGKADSTSGGVRGHHGDFAQGGRVSYFDGGIASLWQR